MEEGGRERTTAMERHGVDKNLGEARDKDGLPWAPVLGRRCWENRVLERDFGEDDAGGVQAEGLVKDGVNAGLRRC